MIAQNYNNLVIQMTQTLRLKSRGGVYYPQVRTFVVDTRKHLYGK